MATGSRKQRGDVERDSVGQLAHHPFCGRGGHRIQRLVVCAHEIRAARQPGREVAVAARRERQQLVADPVAGNRAVLVCRVLHPRAVPVLEVPGEIRVHEVDQRPDDPVARRGNPAEAARASTAEQSQQHRLRLIVGRVGHGHDVGVRASARALEKRVAKIAGGALDRRLPALRLARHVQRPRRRRATSSAPARSRQKLASRADSAPRRQWSKCATATSCRAPAAESSASRCASATESAPPDTAARTRVPCASSRRRRSVASTRAARAVIELGRGVARQTTGMDPWTHGPMRPMDPRTHALKDGAGAGT